MYTLKTPTEPKNSVISGIIGICDSARQLEDSGEYTKAAEALGDWWQGVGIRPDVDGLPDGQKAAVLSRVGALSGWLGSMKQIPDSQEKAKDILSESADLFETANDLQNWGETRSDLAVCYWREGSFEEARVILQHVLDSGFEILPELLGKILLRLVNVEISTKHYGKAMELVNRAASAAAEGSALLRGKLYFHRALIQRGEGEDKNSPDLIRAAIKDYRQAGIYYKKAKHYIYAAAAESNLGNVYRLLNDNKNAHSHFDRAIYLYTKVKDQTHAAQVYDSKAQALLSEDRLKDAEIAARKAVEIMRAGDERSLLSESLTTLGVVLSRRDTLKEAIDTFVEAKEIALGVGDNESAGNAALTCIEELQSGLTPIVFRSLYLEADELLQQSPKISTLDRLKRIARRQFETSGLEVAPVMNWENFSLSEAVRTYEGEIILRALNETSGRVTRAAKLLGLSHQGLSLILHQRHKELQEFRVRRKSRGRVIIGAH